MKRGLVVIILLIVLFTLISINLGSAVSTINEPGLCSNNSLAFCSTNQTECREFYGGMGNVRTVNVCDQDLKCLGDNQGDNVYCIPKDNGCLHDSDCDEVICNTTTYTCETDAGAGAGAGITYLSDGDQCDYQGQCNLSSYCFGNSQNAEVCKPITSITGSDFPNGGKQVEEFVMSEKDFIPHLEFYDYNKLSSEIIPSSFNLSSKHFNSLQSMTPTLCSNYGWAGTKRRETTYMKLAPNILVSIIDQTPDFVDDYFSLSVYDVATGKLVVKWLVQLGNFEEGSYGNRIKKTIVGTDVQNGLNSVTINDHEENRWYKFVTAYEDTGGSKRCDLSYSVQGSVLNNLDSFVAEENNTLMIDSGTFLDDESIPGRLINEIDMGNAKGFSFFIRAKETKLFTPNFVIKGFIASCEREDVIFNVSDNDHTILIKNNNGMSDPVQCNLFVWNKNLTSPNGKFYFNEVPANANQYELNTGLNEFDNNDLTPLISCSDDSPTFSYDTSNNLKITRISGDSELNCGIIVSTNGSNSITWDNGLLDVKRIMLSSDVNLDDTSEEFIFDFDVEGAVVKCENNQPYNEAYYPAKTRYVINGEKVYVYGNPNTYCTVAAWKAVTPPPPVQVLPPGIHPSCDSFTCDYTSEGTICIDHSNDNVTKLCIYDGDYILTSDKNSIFQIKHDLLIGEGRNDVVSNNLDYYSCNMMNVNWGIFEQPPINISCYDYINKFTPKIIHQCDASNSSDINCCNNKLVSFLSDYDSSIYKSVTECLNSCSIDGISDNIDYFCSPELLGDDCDPSPVSNDEGGCVTGPDNPCNDDQPVDYNTPCLQNTDTIICSSNQGCENSVRVITTDTDIDEGDICCYGTSPSCSDTKTCDPNNYKSDAEASIYLCDGVESEDVGGKCCSGEWKQINLPKKYSPLSCYTRGNDSIAFSCGNSLSSTYGLGYGFSTGLIINQIKDDGSPVYSYGNIALTHYKGTNTAPSEVILQLDNDINGEDIFLRHDWTDAVFLEFDFYTNNQLKNLTNFVLITDDTVYPIIDANIFMKGNNQKITKVKFLLPENDSNGININYSNIKTIGVGTMDWDSFSNTALKFSRINLIFGNELICGYKNFIKDPDDYNNTPLSKLTAKKACEGPSTWTVLPQKWTGNYCCGDDIYFSDYSSDPYFEYYADDLGCFAGVTVYDNEVVGHALENDTLDDILFYDKKFFGCDFYDNKTFSYNISNLITGVPTSYKLLAGNAKLFCKEVGAFTCYPDGWHNDDEVDTFILEKNESNFSEGDSVYCEDETLKEPSNITDWFDDEAGFCYQTSCYCPSDIAECAEETDTSVRNQNTGCVYNNSIINGHYCLNGSWTTKNSFVVQTIYNNTLQNQNGILACGPANEILETADSNLFDTACFYSNLDTNIDNMKFVIGIPLNDDVLLIDFLDELAPDYFGVIEGTTFNVTDCYETIFSDINPLQKCFAGEQQTSGKQVTVYYDKDNNIVYIANNDFLENSWWDSIISWWNNLFGINNGVETVKLNFEEIFFYKFNGKNVQAYSKKVKQENNVIQQNYYKLIADSSNDLTEINDWLISKLDDKVEINPVSFGFIAEWNDTADDVEGLNTGVWNLLTSASRYDPRYDQ